MKEKELERVRDEFFGDTRVALYHYRVSMGYKPVFGEGGINSKSLWVGEAPGKNEAEQGRPFCGKSGELLDSMLRTVGRERKDIYITNIVKDRPPENRDPLPEEITSYAPYLRKQIDILKPELIVTLGRFSMKFFLEEYAHPYAARPISELHGVPLVLNEGHTHLFPLYHPAATMYNRSLKATFEEDFAKLSLFL